MMRKILTGLASGALVLSMTTPAFAAPAHPHSSMTRSKTERDHRFRDGRKWDRRCERLHHSHACR